MATHYAKFSRTRFQRFIKDSAIKVNGRIVYKSGLKLKIGDRVSISDEATHSIGEDFLIVPEKDISLEIIYEDKDILVINKQAGLLVHPTANQRHHTLANALVARYPKIINVGESPLRPGIVHRLDKNTSGLMVIAKNQKAFLFLKNQFLGRTISKTYLALVEGIPAEKEGIIRFQIRPSRTNRLKKVALKVLNISGKKSIRTAETRYLVKEKISKSFSLVEAMPKTGRTHQIRVHLSAIGHPVVGDSLYSA
ncbi:MAG: RluA family pseudouridine synthase, partial [Nanoarchaeota archaeon]